ncbi:interferon-inducible GTPase-domain-containing protein [Hyaloraphidium curvatum]|nr:interferon-inducible GTPase-domain-containing protein [Hyaloraphidium curvatum]
MGSVVSAILPVAPVIFKIVETLVSIFSKPPSRPVEVAPAQGKTPAELIAEAQQALGIDPVNYYNIALCGSSGVGKSSLVNALLGILNGARGAAPVGITETTMNIQVYSHPTLPWLKIWGIPGAGTVNHPAATYFADKKLYAFDAIFLVSANRLMEVANDVATGAAEFNRTVGIVWTKADIDLDALLEDDPSITTVEQAKRALRSQVENSRQANGLGRLPLFIVSARNWSKMLRGQAVELFDEEAFFAYIRATVQARARP